MRAALARLRCARGYTITELLGVLTILGVVTTSLTALLVQGSNAQIDMNSRFQAQQEARLALDKLRREVHCASDVTPAGAASTITLTMPSHCPTAGGLTSITWCTKSVAANRFALWRYAGASCAGSGVRVADYLTLGTVFTFTAQSPTSLAVLAVSFPVDTKPGMGARPYTLSDDIVLRNSTRA